MGLSKPLFQDFLDDLPEDFFDELLLFEDDFDFLLLPLPLLFV